MDTRELYSFVKERLTAAKLNELTVQILEAYKAKNQARLKAFSAYVFDESDDEKAGSVRFLKLIKHFHPDRLELLLRDVDDSYASGDEQKLLFFKRLITADTEAKKREAERFSFDHSEYYAYDGKEDSFDEDGFETGSEYDCEGGSPYEDDAAEAVENFDFISAITAEYLGNTSRYFKPADLAELEGELDLSGYGIGDLSGLEYCVNLSILNLSGNCISNLYEVQFLAYLRELYLSDNQIEDLDVLRRLNELEILDLSNNEVEDISALLSIDSLKFVDLRKNPVRDKEALDRLKSRCVVVI